MSKTLFEKIATHEIPAQIVYEDDLVVAFRDINPVAPVHVLIVPKKPIPRIARSGSVRPAGPRPRSLEGAGIAAQLGLERTGYRLVINNGPDGGESVPICIATSSVAAG